MKKLALFILILFYKNAYCQFQEIVGGVGFSYYYGDLNLRNSDNITALLGDFFEIENMKMSYSLGYRYNFPNYLSVGLNLYHMNVSGYDSDNKNVGPSDNTFGRKIRNLNFHTAINQIFFDFRFEPLRSENKWGRNKIHFSPYIGAGLGLFQFNPKSYTKAGQEIELQPLGTEGQGMPGYAKKYSLTQLLVPVNLGIRITPRSRQYSFSLDFNYNHTFTDYIDDVSTTYPNPVDVRTTYQASNPNLYNLITEMSDKRPLAYQQPDKRGNKDDNDFFMTGQIKFSYFLFNQSIDTYYKCCDF